jgi:SpoVK/Ycf46/Vps4 family AAA+-type ATPase
MEEKTVSKEDVVRLARLALLGKKNDVQVFLRRLARRYRLTELGEELGSLLRENSSHSSPLRGAEVEAMPVDLDSRLQLARSEYPVALEAEAIWDDHVQSQLEQIVSERTREAELYKADLQPTKSALFVGPPGVGKTLAARWLAHKLDRPLITLDLSAVMSSFLGRTGNNVRNVIDYAKGVDCVFLLDEFDAIAKRRDDAIEIGELKRLVTVLLQEIDNWPSSGLLLAATNHADLLDPAVWRRFEAIIEFPMPTLDQVAEAIRLKLGPENGAANWSRPLSRALIGLSYAEIERDLLRARREAVMRGEPLITPLQRLVHARARQLKREERAGLAIALTEAGLSQREAHEWTGVSRDTIRKISLR